MTLCEIGALHEAATAALGNGGKRLRQPMAECGGKPRPPWRFFGRLSLGRFRRDDERHGPVSLDRGKQHRHGATMGCYVVGFNGSPRRPLSTMGLEWAAPKLVSSSVMMALVRHVPLDGLSRRVATNTPGCPIRF
jgi:hypothetical protein